MKVALVGIGKMGKEVMKASLHRGVDVVSEIGSNEKISRQTVGLADAIIDFTTAEAFMFNLEALLEIGKPIVVGTTGWYNEIEAIKKKVINENGSLLYASNFSLGVQLFFKLAYELGRIIDPFDSFDVAISEIHHTEKKDQPSGTSIEAARQILKKLTRKKTMSTKPEQGEPLSKSKLLVSSLRLGSVFGKHEIRVDSPSDEIVISHNAKSRYAFAEGSLIAAEWLVGRKGFFSVDDFLNDRIND